MTRQSVTLAVLLRWIKARAEVQRQMQAARSVVVARQLAAMRQSYP